METMELVENASGKHGCDAPPDLVFARHYLQKLGMASPHYASCMRDCIAARLDRAEEVLTSSMTGPCASKYLDQIAEARRSLGGER